VDDVVPAQPWSEGPEIERSELLPEALHRRPGRLASEADAATWAAQPLDEGERSLAAIAEWGPAENWSDRADA